MSRIVKKIILRTKNLDDIPKVPYKGQRVEAKVTDIYDGDTVTVAFMYGLEPIKFSIRIFGIDTPEIKGPYVNKWESEASVQIRDLLRRKILHKYITLEIVDKDKYFRLLGIIYYRGKNIGDWLIDEGFAKPYDGGKKVRWSKTECSDISKRLK